jgi:hypothetical protein
VNDPFVLLTEPVSVTLKVVAPEAFVAPEAWYKLRRQEPPQDSVAFPLQAIVQPLVAGVPPLRILFPQSSHLLVNQVTVTDMDLLTALATALDTSIRIPCCTAGGRTFCNSESCRSSCRCYSHGENTSRRVTAKCHQQY